ncbi:MAG: TusE/DsrC/DsvC family sulfur relay protein [Polyangiaceae bacterium]|nr:TusE/DsrC/DsvC family sulfur relay protein [Myxococcales bacterium]MCC6900837.1 TusE/DsrC/DsvC family sulfur relay protein [Polyangiaceae bacterium]
MATKVYGGIAVEVDDEGFLKKATEWTPEVAKAIAVEVGIPALTDKHWKVLEFARQDTASSGQSPGPRRIVASAGVSMKELYELFPKGPGKLVARVAGVPKPKACL